MTAKQIIAGISRELLGITFLFSGFVKAVDPIGTVYKIEDYLSAFGGIFLYFIPLATIAAVVLILLEWTLGVMMVLDLWTRITKWITLAFYCVMLPLTLYIALTNPVTDCGCFGDALVLTNWQTFWKNVVLITLAIVLLLTDHRHNTQRAAWTYPTRISIAIIMIAAVSVLMIYTHYHLPIIDFRPYKIGNNIPELMEIPDDAPQDIYDITLIYEKDGIEESFTLQNYPKPDSTGQSDWTFVRQESKLISKGYEPPIHDFVLINESGEDMTWEILESEEPVTLVVMYDLKKADKQMMHKIIDLYYSCWEEGAPFYILTSSNTDDVINALAGTNVALAEGLGACVLTSDGIMLKTIVRANPGVIILENGVVKDKYNIRNH